MRAIITGQIGMEKKPYIDATARFAGEQGESLRVYHVGDLMYREGTDVRPGRILDLPISRLNSLRRAAMTTRVYCEPALVELGRRIYLMPPILPENHNGPEPWHLRGGQHGDNSPRKNPPLDSGGGDGVTSGRRGLVRNDARPPPSQ